MSVQNIQRTDTFDQFRAKTNNIATAVGDAATLTTVATTVVGGINEVFGKVGDVDSLETGAPDLVTAINQAQSYAYRITIALG